jgi:predicted phosphodiesterase
MTKAAIVNKYVSENKDAGARTIARAIHQKHPELFETVENARSLVRYSLGVMGDHNRTNRSDKSFFREARDPKVIGKEYALNPVDIGIQDYVFGHKKPLILSDIHLPYHNLEVLEVAINKGINAGCDSVYLNGDIIDMYQISRFLKSGGMPSFNEERETLWEFFEYLKDSMNVPIYYKYGNHEERWEHYILRNAPQLEELTELNLSSILRLNEFGIVPVKGRQKCQMGKLIVLHGHEFGDSIFSPVNPARGLFLKTKASTLAGHNHQTSSHHENNIKNDAIACFSTGALCQLTPEYRPFAYTKWNHGAAIVDIDSEGNFHVDNFRIINGKTY